MRLTLGDIKASSIPASVGLASCDERFTQMVNEAQQRLVMGPDLWWEFTAKYSICATSGLITWPRYVANILQVTLNRCPIPIRNGWFEFLEGGYGERCPQNTCEWQMFDRGTAVTFDDIDTSGDPKKLKLYSTVTEAAGSKMGILGYDSNGEWIRTQVSGEWVDGEWLSVPTDPLTPSISSFYWSTVTEILKPVTNGDLKLYEYEPISITQRQIGLYESDETRPRYRRTLIGGNIQDWENAAGISVQVKKEFIPVRHGKDNDILMIGSLPAMKNMMKAIYKEDGDDLQSAAVFEAKARKIMDDEASHYLGPTAKIPLRVDASAWAMDNVPYVH